MEKSDKSEKVTALDLVKYFGDRTSMHGVRGTFNSTSLWKRIAWALLTLCGIGIAVYQLTNTLRVFYTYPTTTEVSLTHESPVQFPAVTICNLNPVKRSSMTEVHLELFLQEQLGKVNLFTNTTEVIDAYNALYSKFATENSSHNLRDMLISCFFNLKNCSEEFSPMPAGKYGMCYTLAFENLTEMGVNKPGPLYGLVLEMAIQYNEYTSRVPEAGLKVIVHPKDEEPFPEDGGILVPPGVSTSIAIRKTITRRLPAPYGNCISAVDIDGYSYTENSCQKSCYQLSVVKYCNCCDLAVPCNVRNILKAIGSNESNSSIPYCELSIELLHCISLVLARYFNGELYCLGKCAPACSQTTFDTVVSTALWPSDPYMQVLWAQANRTVLKNTTFASICEFKKFVSKNFLKLEIFYEKLDFIEVTTKPMFSWSNLLGNIGGLMGLWLGFSSLTAFEIVELCIDILNVWVQEFWKKRIIT